MLKSYESTPFLGQTLFEHLLRLIAWIRFGHRYDAPVRPDRLLWLDPNRIVHKPVNKPPSNFLKHSLVLDGSWDLQQVPIEHDIVYKSFHKRFVEGKDWDETGYIEFLSGEISEHGNKTYEEALRRCDEMDQLYQDINIGYKTQDQLYREKDNRNLTDYLIPPVYGEVSVSITRDGEFVWQSGMHRLVISKLSHVSKIPVRVHTRHRQWQAIRDSLYSGSCVQGTNDHPDLMYLME